MTKIHVNPNGRTILVTGSPGFIGANLVLRLLMEMKAGTVISLDDMNDCGDAALKAHRLCLIERAADASSARHVFIRGSVADRALVNHVFEEYAPGVVVHLAARDDAQCPEACVESNLAGFFNVIDACRRHPVAHLVYASSDSVYGDNKKMPSGTDDRTDHPLSLYAATKRSNELMAYSFASRYGIPCTGLRFFSVFGPTEGPDGFCRAATDALLRGDRVPIPNGGNCLRDFIYIDDAVEALFRVMQGAPRRGVDDDDAPAAPYALCNVGSGRPENLLDFLSALHQALISAGLLPADHDLSAHRELSPMQPGEAPVTCADTGALEADYGCRPAIGIREGLKRFAEWYREQM